MRLLLDTHALIWWLSGDAALSSAAHMAIADPTNEILVSAASAWEITTKHSTGKLPGAAQLAADVAAGVARQGFRELAVTMRHAQMAGGLPGPHRDPFDRMLIAQAQTEKLLLLTADPMVAAYGDYVCLAS